MSKKKPRPSRKAKPAAKTTAETTVMVEQPHGGALRMGGSNAGGPGRPADEFRAVCRQALEDAKGMDVVKAIISGDIYELVGHDIDGAPIYAETRNKDRLGAIAFLAAYGFGKPTQTVEVVDPAAPQTGAHVVERVLAGIERLLPFVPKERRALLMRNAKMLKAGGELEVVEAVVS